MLKISIVVGSILFATISYAKSCPQLEGSYHKCSISVAPGTINAIELAALKTAVSKFKITINRDQETYTIYSSVKMPLMDEQTIEDTEISNNELKYDSREVQQGKLPDSELSNHILCNNFILEENISWNNLSADTYGNEYYQKMKTWKNIKSTWSLDNNKNLIRNGHVGESKNSLKWLGTISCLRQ